MQKAPKLISRRVLRLPRREFDAAFRRIYKVKGLTRALYQDAVIYPIRPFYPLRLPIHTTIDDLLYPEPEHDDYGADD